MPRPEGNRRINYVPAIVRSSAALLLCLYTIILVQLTLQDASAESGIFDRLDSIMLTVSGGHVQWTQTEVLANVALFVPAGLLLAVLLGRAWASVVACIAVSAAIELAQQRYLPSRVPSLEDVQHNSIGGAIGALTAWPLLRWSGRKPSLHR
jgi:glycopeptide antibiotics resistance protein